MDLLEQILKKSNKNCGFFKKYNTFVFSADWVNANYFSDTFLNGIFIQKNSNW